MGIVDRFADLNLELALTPRTAAMLSLPFGEEDQSGRLQFYKGLEIADKVISLSNIYDIVGANGPYHPAIEEIREHKLLADFRKWAATTATDASQRETVEIAREVDIRIKILRETSLDRFLAKKRYVNVPLTILKDIILDLIPGASTICNVLEIMSQRKSTNGLRWQAFIAQSRDKLAPISRSRYKP